MAKKPLSDILILNALVTSTSYVEDLRERKAAEEAKCVLHVTYHPEEMCLIQ